MEENGSCNTEGPGPSSTRPTFEEVENSITLLDEPEALELVEFYLKVIRNLLMMHFNKSLSEEERESILKASGRNLMAICLLV